MAYNFFKGTLKDGLSNVNKDVRNMNNKSIGSKLISNNNMLNKNMIGMNQGGGQQVMAHTPGWWSQEHGIDNPGIEGETQGEMGSSFGGGYTGGGTGGIPGGGGEPSEWTPEEIEIWMNVQGPGGWLNEGWGEYVQSMGYTSNNVLDDIADMIQNEGSSYEDIINMLQGGYGFNQSGGWGASGIDIDIPEYLQEDPLADYTYSPSTEEETILDSLVQGNKRARNLYYGGTGGGATKGFASSNNPYQP